MPDVTRIVPPTTRPPLGLREAWQYRFTCIVLARRAVMARYRQTVLGLAWSLLQPIALVILFDIVFGWLGRPETQGLDFTVFHATGVFAFYIVSRQIAEGSQSVVTNATLVKRVYFPRIYLPVSVALARLVDTAGLIITAILLSVASGVQLQPQILLLPLFVLVAYVFSLGASFLFSALNAKFRDVDIVLPFLLQVMFFLSPIIYPATIVPTGILPLYYLNPLALVIAGFRWTLADAPMPDPSLVMISVTSAVTTFIIGYVYFRSREPFFPDVL